MAVDQLSVKGCWLGHWFRRVIHISMILLPWLYYQYGNAVAAFFTLTPPILLWILLFLTVILEIVRLGFGIQAFGQRVYERLQISAFAWGAISLFLVLLFAPKQFAYPIIASCALGDPLVGELRRARGRLWWVAVLAAGFISGLWLFAWYWLATPWWWAFIMGPLMVALEWPRLQWVDDNALMLLVPLIVVLIQNWVVIHNYLPLPYN